MYPRETGKTYWNNLQFLFCCQQLIGADWFWLGFKIRAREKHMNLFAGLYSYEIVLVVLGIVLFLVLVIALLRNVFKDKPFAALIPALFIPIVMIGYPSIQSIQYQNGVIEITKAFQQVQDDPSDPQAQAQLNSLEPTIAKLEPRTATDPATQKLFVQAEKVLSQPSATNFKPEERKSPPKAKPQ